MVSEGCVVDGYVDFSVLFQSVVIEEGATVRDSIVLPGSVIKKGANIQYAIIGENCVVEEGATVGQRPENVENMDNWGIAVLGNGVTVGAKLSVPAKGMIYEDVKEAE